MSDATLPPPRSSSVAPATMGGDRSDSSSVEVDSDTSLIHSTDAESKEGGAEERPEHKQRRKRTSPKDQAVLEAEYTQNPKPNKAARAIIVDKVDMNEKEVQIWFQNRRQINRRKSRPLLPHEIVAYGLGGLPGLSSDPPVSIIPGGNQSNGDTAIKLEEEEMLSSQENITSSQELQKLPELKEIENSTQITKDDSVKLTAESTEDSQISTLPHVPMLKRQSSSSISSSQTPSTSVTESVYKSFSSTPGYLSNRWNAVNSSFSTPSPSQNAPLVTPPISHPVLPSSCPQNIGGSDNSTTSSKVRLTMSLDGKAQLTSTEPSPPHEPSTRPSSSGAVLPQRRVRGLQRSQSALPFEQFPRMSSINGPFIPRLFNGRSRDARTWEFCCDTDARDELTAQAENESSGSAVAAISLMRSTSKTALKSNINKRNAPSAKQDLDMHGKRPKLGQLGRAMSSLARLQSTEQSSSKSFEPRKNKGDLLGSPSGDSDKENWAPSENGGNARRRPLPQSRPDKPVPSKSILGDNFNVPTHAFSLGGSKNRRRKGTRVEPKVFEDEENAGVVGEEVGKFMRGEISPSKKGDLDCVQGLLSLSQGNWR